MKHLENELSSILGFNPKKSKVYLAMLELGEATAAEIARKAGLKRTSVYNILPELLQESIIAKTKSKTKTLFYIDSPKDLKLPIENKAVQVEELIKKLLPFQNLFHNKHTLKIYEGLHGLEKTYEDVVATLAPGEIHRVYLGYTEMYMQMPQDLIDKWARKRVEKNCLTKMIMPNSPIAQVWKKRSKEYMREIKIVKDLTDLNGELKIYGNKVALTAYQNDYLSIVIESKEVSDMLRSMFDMLWQFLPKE